VNKAAEASRDAGKEAAASGEKGAAAGEKEAAAAGETVDAKKARLAAAQVTTPPPTMRRTLSLPLPPTLILTLAPTLSRRRPAPPRYRWSRWPWH